MKHGKKPTREQRKLLMEWGMDTMLWLVVKDTPEAMTVVHKYSDKTVKVIPKEGEQHGIGL